MALINCSECGTKISDKATACPKCGAPVKSVSTLEVQRAALTQADMNKNLYGPFVFQTLLLASAAGFYGSSWLVFGLTFLGLLVLFMIPVVRRLVGFAIAFALAALGYVIARDTWTETAGWIAAVLLFVISLGASLGGADYLKDAGKKQ